MARLRIPGYGLETPGPIVVGVDPDALAVELIRVGGGILVSGNANVGGLTSIFGGLSRFDLTWDATLGATLQSYQSKPLRLNHFGNDVLLDGAGTHLVLGVDPGGAEALRIGGAARIAGVLAVTGTPRVPASIGGPDFALDTSLNTTSPGVTVANNATQTLAGAGFSGLAIVNDTATTGNVGVYIVISGTPTLIAATGDFSIINNNAGTLNLINVGGLLCVQNKTGASRTINTLFLRTRAA